MRNKGRHQPLTAQHAARIALGAFYNAAKSQPEDSSLLLERWLLDLTSKLKRDDITRVDFETVLRRWEEEENPLQSRPRVNGLHPAENAPDNPSLAEVANG